jgi:short-subunit dehydrogenase
MSKKGEKKVAIITGASGGIGKGVARYFLEKNYKTILVARHTDRLQDLCTEYCRDDVKILKVNLRNYEEIVENINAILDNQARVDVLVNSAGYVKRGTSDLEHEEFVKMLETNLVGLFDITSIIIPIMKKQGSGRIINISSYSGVVARDCLGGYAASKFGLMGLNEALHKELAPYGIYVTAICPNLVDTEMTKDVISIERNQFIQVDDVVKTIDYLLSLTSSVMIKELVLRCRAKLLKTIDG